ncbi:MAG: PadR family transcriptional regulator [Actinomycetota bacterium]|jgi:DNA-binding PadR family transcriptional regulator|nr:PadR family transcriptional regulator [Actinomycetota bacterium]
MALAQRSDPSLLVLVSLAEGPKHGYALTKDIEAFAGISLGPGTLYGCIARLEGRGLIEALPAEDRRNPYRLTAAGATALREELERAAATSALGLRRLEVGPV